MALMHRSNKITNSLTRIGKAKNKTKTSRWLDLYVQNESYPYDPENPQNMKKLNFVKILKP